MIDELTLNARGVALTRAYLDDLEYDVLVRPSIDGFKLANKEREFLWRVWDARAPQGRPLLSNRHVRRAGLETMVDLMLKLEDSHPNRRHYFGTFCWDAGLTWEDCPYVGIPALQHTVYKALRELKLDGFTVAEVDVLRPLHDGPGQRLYFHVHCVCWKTAGSKFKPKVAARKLMASKRFPNSLDAPSVKFKLVESGAIHFARVGGYLMKLRAHCKNRVPRKNGEYRLRKTKRGFTSASALRLLEVLSHISIFDVVRGVGPEGRSFVKAWKKGTQRKLRQGRSRSRSRTEPDEDVDARWRSIRERNGSRRYRQTTIITSSNRRIFKPRPREASDTAYIRARPKPG